MNRLGIKYQILLTTLIPVLLIDSFFTYTHITTSIEQQNALLHSKGQIVARQIADAVEYYLITSNEVQLQKLLDQAVDADEIVSASIYDRQGVRISDSKSNAFKPQESIEYYYFRQPVLSRSDAIANHRELDPGASRPQVLGWVNLYISKLQLQQQTLQIIAESGLFFVLVLIVALVLTIIISRRITQPIFDLMESLRYVETGQLGRTIEPTQANEIGALQRGFNRMTQALLANRRHLNQRIQQATQQLNGAITELESKNRELELARNLARNENRSKSEFLANMSHEIRTPINGIKGFISLLGQSRLNPSQRRYVDIITKSTRDLTGIVNEILDFSKMESGKLQIVDETFDLYEVIEQTRDILFINVLAKDIDLNLIIFSDTPRWVRGDKLRLKQILLNLIGNAVKFTDQGRVVIRVSLQDIQQHAANILISVEDSGIGISEQDQQSLFQAFSQVEKSDSRRFSGTGLGLVISKNLARLMGGDISMQSTPGKGSRFSLDLPFELADEHDNFDEPAADASRALILAVEQNNLMEIRTLFDRAGAITEAELLDPALASDSILSLVQRSRACIELLVLDLRQLDIDLLDLLQGISANVPRIVLMHYDPHYELQAIPANVEFVSIINTSQSIARIVAPNLAEDDAGEQTERESPVTPSTQRKKVLLVDDNQVNLKLASELIRLWGHEVLEAEHADSAFALYRQETFDLVILDIQMPDIDGVSLMQMMREYYPDDKTPIVALTANVLNREGDRLLELGFDYFLGKPVDESSFRALLDGQLQRRGAGEDRSQAAAVESGSDCSLDYERSLQLSAGNPSLLKQILEILRSDIPEQRRHLFDAYREQDFERLGALAHKLHGVTCYASLPRLRRIVAAFEQQLADEAHDGLRAMVEKLDGELEAVREEVESYLQRLDEMALSG